MAGSIGIKKIHGVDEFWAALEQLGDRQSFYLLEQYVPGDIYHVDSIFYEGEVLFSIASRYGRPPMDVSQAGRHLYHQHIARWIRRKRCR